MTRPNGSNMTCYYVFANRIASKQTNKRANNKRKCVLTTTIVA